MSRLSAVTAVCLTALCGCISKLEEQTKPTGSIIGKTTQDIGEFDAKAEQEVSDSKVRVSDPLLGSLEAYGPAVEQIAKMRVENELNTFNAINQRYPKDHEEFMQEIIKANNIQLPVLPAKGQWKYNVAEHRLEVIRVKPKEEEKDE